MHKRSATSNSAVGGSAIAGLVLLALAAAARAQSLDVQVSSTDAFLGEAVIVDIKASRFGEKVSPVPPQTKDFDIQPAPNNPIGSFQSVQIINGRTTMSVDYTYRFFARPLRLGQVVLPPFSMQYKGLMYQTKQIPINVAKESGSELLFCEIKSDTDSAYVGQEVTLTLEVWVQQFQQAGVGQLDAGTMWSPVLRDMNSTTVGVFDKVDWDRPKYNETTRSDAQGVPRKYFVFVIEKKVSPGREGPFDFGSVAVSYNYPKRFTSRGFEPLRLRAIAKTPTLNIKPLPTEGRPADFNGAIGRYMIAAFVKPAEIPVGDPITLTLEISGEGSLEQLSPPRLNQVEELTRDFEVSGESLAGELRGNKKIFSQTIRPRREDVTQVPSVPISFLNAKTGKFESAWSQPIPIKVRPAERLALPTLPGPGSLAPILAPLAETTEGLLANETDPASVLADQNGGLGPATAAVLVAMPVVYLATWLVQRRLARYRDDETWRRRSRAYATAKKALGAAESSASPGQVRAAVAGYVADRCGVPAGGITRAEAVKLLADRGVPAEIVQSIDELLGSLELAEYGQQSSGAMDGQVASARQIVDSLEKRRWK